MTYCSTEPKHLVGLKSPSPRILWDVGTMSFLFAADYSTFLVCLLYLTLRGRLLPYNTSCLLKVFFIFFFFGVCVFNEVTLSERGAVTDLLKLKPSDSPTNKGRKREGFVFARIKFLVYFPTFFLN